MASSFRSSFTPIAPKRRVLPTVLTFMAGPPSTSNQSNSRKKPTIDIFDLLRRAVNEKRRIEVLTRDCRGIDGILIGWLIVFDKHMNLIMSDVDEVCRRLTDGQDYLELGAKQEENQPPPPLPLQPALQPSSSSTTKKSTNVPEDFQSFRAKLANFLKNKKKPEQPAPKPRRRNIQHDGDDSDDDNDLEKRYQDENQVSAECHPERFLSMQLLTINNVNVQRLSGKTQAIDDSSASSTSISTVVQMSKRPKVRFFSRHIPKMFVKGNQICLIRLLPT